MPDRDLMVHPIVGYPLDLGTALWMMKDTRERTLRAIDDMGVDDIDLIPAGADNSIGSLLYHLAAIEADWLYADILQVDYPEWMNQLFPADVRTDDGHLTPVEAAGLHEHLDRLATVRRHFLEDIAALDGFRSPLKSESGVTTAEWVLHHLRQHEAEHRGQIQSIRKALEISRSP